MCNCCVFFWLGDDVGWFVASLAGEGVMMKAWKTRMCRAKATQWPGELFEASPASRACK